jgi:hypothetical protein
MPCVGCFVNPSTKPTTNENRTSFGDQFIAEWRANRSKVRKIKKIKAKEQAKTKQSGYPRKLKTARSPADKQRRRNKKDSKANGSVPSANPAPEMSTANPSWIPQLVLGAWAMLILSCPSSVNILFSWIATTYSTISAIGLFWLYDSLPAHVLKFLCYSTTHLYKIALPVYYWLLTAGLIYSTSLLSPPLLEPKPSASELRRIDRFKSAHRKTIVMHLLYK